MQRTADFIQGITNLFIGVVSAFLGLRFVLRLLNADAGNQFVSWTYDVSAQLLEPFRGIFPSQEIEPGYVIEFSTLFAILAYSIFGFLVLALVDALRPDPVVEAETTQKTKKK